MINSTTPTPTPTYTRAPIQQSVRATGEWNRREILCGQWGDCYIKYIDSCVSFQVSPGTGCAWMCQYCKNRLGTTNYYFTDGVCKYQTGGCIGSPQVGVEYTCCTRS